MEQKNFFTFHVRNQTFSPIPTLVGTFPGKVEWYGMHQMQFEDSDDLLITAWRLQDDPDEQDEMALKVTPEFWRYCVADERIYSLNMADRFAKLGLTLRFFNPVGNHTFLFGHDDYDLEDDEADYRFNVVVEVDFKVSGYDSSCIALMSYPKKLLAMKAEE